MVVKWLLAVAWEWRKNKLRKIEIGRQNEMINMLDSKIETIQDTMNTILLNQNQQSREIRVLRNNFNSRPKSLQSEYAVPNIFHPQFCSTPAGGLNNNRKLAIPKRRTGIRRSTTFPSVADEQAELQSEFSIPHPN